MPTPSRNWARNNVGRPPNDGENPHNRDPIVMNTPANKSVNLCRYRSHMMPVLVVTTALPKENVATKKPACKRSVRVSVYTNY